MKMSHTSYMDGVRVKISERYKPPPKITLPTTYSQRISLNKQIQDGIPKYDFGLERTVKGKMTEYRDARSAAASQRKLRVERAREIREKLARKELEYKSEGDFKNDHNLNNFADVLIPTQVNRTTAGVLTPTQLGDMKEQN